TRAVVIHGCTAADRRRRDLDIDEPTGGAGPAAPRDMTIPGRPPGRKTYTRLAAGRRIPPEYELLSTDLHYNYPRRVELTADLSIVDWYYRHREGGTTQVQI